jgi:threonyl-tRNA synthetase
MILDEEHHPDGTVKKAGQQYYMKPMNCPFHNLIFRARGRSYRELPLRLFEFGTVYRYEKSGVMHGLTRARGFTQDDAHIYCTKEQMPTELDSLLTFVLNLLRDYGLNDFYLELSTRNPEKSVGDDQDWTEATEALRKAAEAQKLELVLDEGGAAFYGPKISVQAKDAIGRTRQRPVMIHRALFGSIERFFGVLTEHYSGAFPPWLAPMQAVGIPVADAFADYLADVISQMKKAGIRAELDASDDRMQKKVRNAQMQKIPFMVIAGEEDQKAGAVSFRYRNGEQKNGIPIAQAIAEIQEAVSKRIQV